MKKLIFIGIALGTSFLLFGTDAAHAQNRYSTVQTARRNIAPSPLIFGRRTAPAHPQIQIRGMNQQERIQFENQRLLRQNNIPPMQKVENGEFSQAQERVAIYGQARQNVTGKPANNRGAVVSSGILFLNSLIQGLDPQLRSHPATPRRKP